MMRPQFDQSADLSYFVVLLELFKLMARLPSKICWHKVRLHWSVIHEAVLQWHNHLHKPYAKICPAAD